MAAASPVREPVTSQDAEASVDTGAWEEPSSPISPLAARGMVPRSGNGRPRNGAISRVVDDDTRTVRPGLAVNVVETVAISLLRPAVDSPRLEGEDARHVELLAASEAALPPILVHRQSMRVIDGNHRLRAAILQGREEIDVVYFDGGDESAFVAAVEANISHGLPLSLADRKAAAARIVGFYPHWSDRAIARLTGLSAKSIASIRRTTVDSQQLDSRVGRDGRVRPLDGTIGRLRAASVIEARPEASLREVARAAGVSPTTARDVRERVKRGEDPLLQRHTRRKAPPTETSARATSATGGSRAAPTTAAHKRAADSELDPALILGGLRNDPSLRLTEAGRALLRLLDVQARGPDECRRAAEQIPSHCVYTLAKLARAMGNSWSALALEFERQIE